MLHRCTRCYCVLITNLNCCVAKMKLNVLSRLLFQWRMLIANIVTKVVPIIRLTICITPGYNTSARNNSWPLAIFQPISTFGRPKSILVGQFYCTFSMGWQSITYKMSYLQKKQPTNFWPLFLPLIITMQRLHKA